MEHLKVMVAGGGIGGLAAALCLADAGHHVSVFEQNAGFNEAGAGIQLSPNCTRVLHSLGLEAGLRDKSFLPQGTQFRSWRSGNVIAENPLGETALKKFGFPYYHIHRGDLLQVLLDAARRQPNITLYNDAVVTGFEVDRAVVLKTERQTFDGQVLIGADGIHSVIRSTLWGDLAPQFTGNVAWRALVPTSVLPPNFIRPMSTVWWGPQKHFVHYYVKQGEFVNCVCVVEKQGWEIESWTEPGAWDEFRADFTGWHPDIQMLIEHVDRDSLFKWGLFDRPPMPQWGKGPVSLLGDACHPTLPFMAQGAAMAIEDAAVLTSCLTTGSDIRTSLQRYENLRRDRTAGIQRGSRRNATVFHLAGIKAWLRNRATKVAGSRTMDNLYSYNALDVAVVGDD